MSSDRLLTPIFVSDELLDVTSDEALATAMLRFWSELAGAQAELGLLDAAASDAVAAACEAGAPNRPGGLDLAGLGGRSRSAGNPVPALLAALRERSGALDGLHGGATSQDAIDTALCLVAGSASALVLRDAERARRAATLLADRHAATPMLARTLLQPAVPATFGLLAAGWASGLESASRELERAAGGLAVQLGGAGGTLASIGAQGQDVVDGLARRLGLAAPRLPWHAERSRFARLAGALALLAGSAGKPAGDVVLLSQAELGELAEPGGGSSAMPQKRNPAIAIRARAAAMRAPGLAATIYSAMDGELARAAGAWHSEWEPLRDLLRLAGGAVSSLADSLESIEVRPERMRENLERFGATATAEQVVAALAPELGSERARELVTAAAARAAAPGSDFAAALASEPEIAAALGRERIAELADPTGYLGSAERWAREAGAGT